MNIRNTLVGVAMAAGLSATVFSTGVFAAQIDGKSRLVCAPVKVVACTEGRCLQGEPQTFDLSTFIFVDFQKKIVHGVDKDGKQKTSAIKSNETTDKAVILQGYENHAGWTMAVDRNDGGLTMSSIGVDVNFIIKGNCTQF